MYKDEYSRFIPTLPICSLPFILIPLRGKFLELVMEFNQVYLPKYVLTLIQLFLTLMFRPKHRRSRVGVTIRLPQPNFETPHFTPFNIFFNTLDYTLKPFKPLILPL